MAVVVVDYGSGNLRSMANALERVVGRDRVTVTCDAGVIASAERIVLPGVGAFAACMRQLDRGATIDALKQAAARRTPLLGVCVGMQVFATEGREFENAGGLDLVPGVVEKIVPTGGAKLPHVGFARVDFLPTFSDELGIAANGGAGFYFVHSYALQPSDASDCVGVTEYAGAKFCSAVRRGNLIGTQFHPEKSGAAGLAFLRAFCAWRG